MKGTERDERTYEVEVVGGSVDELEACLNDSESVGGAYPNENDGVVRQSNIMVEDHFCQSRRTIRNVTQTRTKKRENKPSQTTGVLPTASNA